MLIRNCQVPLYTTIVATIIESVDSISRDGQGTPIMYTAKLMGNVKGYPGCTS